MIWEGITMESPLCEVIIERTKIQLSKGLLRTPRFKGFTQETVNITKFLLRLHKIEAEEDRTRIEMKGV